MSAPKARTPDEHETRFFILQLSLLKRDCRPGQPAGKAPHLKAVAKPSDGIGPNLVINANLIMGNAAEAGSGGGLCLQEVNGSDVLAFPTTPSQWYSPLIANNIIADNVAGWDGAGISLVDAFNVNIINNTVVSNSTTASAGILFTTIGAPLVSGREPTAYRLGRRPRVLNPQES